MYGETNLMVQEMARAIAAKRNARRVESGEDDIGIMPSDVTDALAALDALDAHGNFKNWVEVSRAIISCPDQSLEALVLDLRDAMPTDQFQQAFRV